MDKDFIPEIVKKLEPMVDPKARASRIEKERIAASKILRHIPSYKVCQYEINSKLQLKPMFERIRETNDKLLQSDNENDRLKGLTLNDKKSIDYKLFVHLENLLSDQKNFHVAEFPEKVANFVSDRLLQWPTQHILPVFDMVLCVQKSIFFLFLFF